MKGSDDMAMSLFMELFGEEFNAEDEEHQEQMEMLMMFIKENPDSSPAQLITKFMRENVEDS